jgi:hypothetical protein
MAIDHENCNPEDDKGRLMLRRKMHQVVNWLRGRQSIAGHDDRPGRTGEEGTIQGKIP